jgi:thiol-disulfide isomerase/thioredoxin
VSPPEAANSARRLAMVAAGGLAGIALGLAAIYGISAFLRNQAGDPSCQATVNAAARLLPLVRGEVAAFTVAEKPLRLSDLAFHDGGRTPRKLADWAGRTALVNLWATWCVPCRKEMPALDAIEAALGGPRFEVIAINIDTRDPEKPRAWLSDVGIAKLAYYADPTAKVFQDLKGMGLGLGLPTTLLIDPLGCEIGSMAGPAEWASEDGMALVKAALR